MKGSERKREHHDDYDSAPSIALGRVCARILYIDAALETCPISVYVPSVRWVGNPPGPPSPRCTTSNFSRLLTYAVYAARLRVSSR